MPNGIELSPHEDVERAEEGILDGEVFHFELSKSKYQGQLDLFGREVGERRGEGTYISITSLNLTQRRLHAIDDRSLNLHHPRTERLIHLDDVSFPLLKVVVDCRVESVPDSESQLGVRRAVREAKGTNRGQMIVSRSLSWVRTVWRGERPKVKCSGWSEKALRKPVCWDLGSHLA